jgi:hypothetical protein
VLVYSEPDADSRILGFVAAGTQWTQLETSSDGEWVRIDFGGSDPGGWIRAANAVVNP